MTEPGKTDAKACPTKNCLGPDAAQETVSQDTLTSAGVSAAWAAHARRCASCGCVYSSEEGRTVLRGYFGNAIVGPGWRPIFGGGTSR